MSRFIKNRVPVPDGVKVVLGGGGVRMEGPAGAVERQFDDPRLVIEQSEDGLLVRAKGAGPDAAEALALAGTYWRLLLGMATGAKTGAEKTLELVGVGYRAQMEGNDITLQLGYSRPARYSPPAGVALSTPTQTEVVVKGADKSLVGQVAADIRALRPPEPYKGKGVRYRGERVVMKEMKKK